MYLKLILKQIKSWEQGIVDKKKFLYLEELMRKDYENMIKQMKI